MLKVNTDDMSLPDLGSASDWSFFSHEDKDVISDLVVGLSVH